MIEDLDIQALAKAKELLTPLEKIPFFLKREDNLMDTIRYYVRGSSVINVFDNNVIILLKSGEMMFMQKLDKELKIIYDDIDKKGFKKSIIYDENLRQFSFGDLNIEHKNDLSDYQKKNRFITEKSLKYNEGGSFIAFDKSVSVYRVNKDCRQGNEIKEIYHGRINVSLLSDNIILKNEVKRELEKHEFSTSSVAARVSKQVLDITPEYVICNARYTDINSIMQEEATRKRIK